MLYIKSKIDYYSLWGNLEKGEIYMSEQEGILRTIYNTILRLLSLNDDITKLEDLKRVLLIINNYHQLKGSKELLIMSLHICQLDNWENTYTFAKIKQCIQMTADLS